MYAYSYKTNKSFILKIKILKKREKNNTVIDKNCNNKIHQKKTFFFMRFAIRATSLLTRLLLLTRFLDNMITAYCVQTLDF